MHIHPSLMAEMAFSTAAVRLLLLLMTMMLVSAGAAAAAVASSPPIGMPNCETRCGNVDVPYPFGLGSDASCYLPGFNLTCDHTVKPPRLLIGASLRVKYIDIDFSSVSVVHTVDANTASLLGGALDLHDSPYSLPGMDSNELVVMGCNVQATLLRNPGNITVSGCLSICSDHVYAGGPPSSRITGCCLARTFIGNIDEDDVVATYSVRPDWFGGNRSADKKRAPFRAFLAREGWFDDWWNASVGFKNEGWSTSSMWPRPLLAMEVPVDLDWKIGASLWSQYNFSSRSKHSSCGNGARRYTCSCDRGYRGNAYVPNGCQVDKCEGVTCYGVCIMKEGLPVCQCPSGTQGNSAMPGGCLNSTVIRAAAAAGNCMRWCGGLYVPYPFGIQDMGPAGCYKPGFNLTCDTRGPGQPRLLLGDDGDFRVVEIHLDNATVRAVRAGPFINASTNYAFSPSFHFEDSFSSLSEAPYSLSTANELVLTGCDARVSLYDDNTDGPDVLGIRCVVLCPLDDDNIQHRRRTTPNDKYCNGMGCCQSHISMSMDVITSMLKLDWNDQKSDSANETPPPTYVFIAEEGWFDHLGFSGQLGPNLQPPSTEREIPVVLQWEVLSNKTIKCSDGNICKSKHSYCKPGDRGGYTCHCNEGYRGNPYVNDADERCKDHSHKSVIIGVSVGAGLSSAAGLIISFLIGRFISDRIKHRRAQMLKRKFYEQNRGQLLEQLVSQRADIAERMIIPLEELEKATSNFDKDREIGGGGHGTVYKGILSDLHVVAIKKPKKVVQREIDEFINEVAILSQINHRNVVKLYGCCLETEVPMLVYEFISNGTLYEHLHVDGPRSLSWNDRLRIAVETARSLAYLHSTASIPIIHRDVKSANILLDEALTAKVADFGASRYISVEKSGLTTMVQGTIGYLDPMYFCTGRLTERSDVYSYGVMLVELLTRKKPFSYLSPEDKGLVAHFVALFAEGNLSEMLDPQVTDEGDDEVQEAAALAVACVKLRGEDRPTMRQVELTLEGLRPSKKHVSEDAGFDRPDKNSTIERNSPWSLHARRCSGEGSARQYTMEAELTMSSRYPR